MKTQWIRSAGVLLLSVILVAGLNAQPRRQGGQGLNPGNGKFHPDGPRYGQSRGNGNGQGAGFHSQQNMLDLSQEQQEEMKTLRMEHYKTMKPLKNEMAELKARERTLLSEQEADMKAINSVIDDQSELLGKIRKLQVEQKLKMKEILTDEQIMKLDQRKHHGKRRARA